MVQGLLCRLGASGDPAIKLDETSRNKGRNRLNSLLIMLVISAFLICPTLCASALSSEYYLSELEYKLIDLDDYMLDYEFGTYSTTCDTDHVLISPQANAKFTEYQEPQLQSPLKNMIIYSNQQMLKVNAVGLLANATLITFIDDASTTSTASSSSSQQSTTTTSSNLNQLSNLRAFNIPGEIECDNLRKVTSRSFVFECSKSAAAAAAAAAATTTTTNADSSASDNSDQSQIEHRIVTLYYFNATQTEFNNPIGIDLSGITPIKVDLTFNPISGIKGTFSGDKSAFLSEYDDCVREANFFESSDAKSTINYFRYCKYHETNMKLLRNGNTRQYSQETSSFFEMYSIPVPPSDMAGNTVAIANWYSSFKVSATTPRIFFNNYALRVQGVLQFQDGYFCVLDYNDGLLFFTAANSTTTTTTGSESASASNNQSYVNLGYFVKYFYDQKYLNIYVQKNIDSEFTISELIPNYLVINTQSYIISYALADALTESKPEYLDRYPTTISIARFVEAVKMIHAKNELNQQEQAGQQASGSANKIIPNIMDVTQFRSIRYDFDQYLYYIQINYVNEPITYYLLINRALTDFSTNVQMNPYAIELDLVSQNGYSKMFHYSIPGLFYSSIRTRVRLFQATWYNDSADGIYIPTNLKSPLSIRTESWKSPQVLNLFTQEFSEVSTCSVELTFTPKPTSQAVGSIQSSFNLTFIPRDFTGVLSKFGQSISLNFQNPRPYFEIKDWFFGAALDYEYNPIGNSPSAQINVLYSSTTSLTPSTDAPSSKKAATPSNRYVKLQQEDPQSNSSSTEVIETGPCSNPTDNSSCSPKVISAIQVQNNYFIFYQNCTCMFWFETCAVTDKQKLLKTSFDQASQPINTCLKSLAVNITTTADKVLFDGENVLISQQRINTSTVKPQSETTTNPLKVLTTKDYEIIFMKIDASTSKTTPKFVYQNNTAESNQTTSTDKEIIQTTSDDDDDAKPITYSSRFLILQATQTQSTKSFSPTQQFKRIRRGLPGKVINDESRDSSGGFTSIFDSQNFNQNTQLFLTQPQNLNVGSITIGLYDMHLFSVPNTNKFCVITQSSALNKRSLWIFSLSNNAKDIAFYKFTDATDSFQDSFDVSLLDQGILFASRNQTSTTRGSITVYKVNFPMKTISIDRVFSQSDMIEQIKSFQLINKSDNNNSSNGNKSTDSATTAETHNKNVLIDDPASFMNAFAVKIWRSDEQQTYRLLVIDYLNNCIFDYLLYDLIRPIFVRQISLFNFTITRAQNFQITNNMMTIHAEKEGNEYLISLDIIGESINQVKAITQQTDQKNYYQVQTSMFTQYEEGSMCRVSTSPSSAIQCIFNPFIQLNFDFSTAASAATPSSTESSVKQNGSNSASSIPTQLASEDKMVSFNVGVNTPLMDSDKLIILRTNFSNFDTQLIRRKEETRIAYNVSAGVPMKDEPFIVSELDTSFVKGSIEQYSVTDLRLAAPSSSQQGNTAVITATATTSPEAANVTVQGYIYKEGVKTQVLNFDDEDEIQASDRNPYQLVGLAENRIIVMNQNLRFKFDFIYKIDYTDIQIRSNSAMNNNNNNSILQPQYVVKTCMNIFSNQIQVSATTETYRYILECEVTQNGHVLPSNVYITFAVDINPFSSLQNQGRDWSRAMNTNVQLVKINFQEEKLPFLIQYIKYISILSLTDSYNNIGGYIVLIVREIKEAQNNSPSDNTIYILWGGNNPLETNFSLEEIDQINSSDFDLNYMSVKNFVANFPSTFPNQSRMDSTQPQEFIFNIGWDDGTRNIFVSLLKLTLPPMQNYEDSTNYQKQIFSSKYQDIYSRDFSSFIKPTETWTNPFTPLKSTITFHSTNYNANVLITNEFSIIEFTIPLSPAPDSTTPSQQVPSVLDTTIKSSSSRLSTENYLNKILTYTQYAWCENQFSNDQAKQQLLKYNSFLIIQCQHIPSNPSSGSINAQKQFILKVYKIMDCDSSPEEDVSGSSTDVTSQQQQTQKYSTRTAGSPTEQDFEQYGSSYQSNKQQQYYQHHGSLKNNVKYSMVESIAFQSGKSIDFMSFRTENELVYLDLIVNSFEENHYELLQFPVNEKPILVYPANITDGSTVSVCVENRYTESLCSTAVLVNPLIDTHDISVKEWIEFSGLVALPFTVTLAMLITAFLSMKKMRKTRQDEFIQLLMCPSQISEGSNTQSVLSVDPVAAVEGDAENAINSGEERANNQRVSIQHRNRMDNVDDDDETGDYLKKNDNMTLSERRIASLDKLNRLRDSFSVQK